MKCRIFDVVRELVGVGVIVGLGIGTAPANAAIETLEFSGYFLSGSVAPFPLFPATISGMVVYDTTNSGVVTPYNYTFVNSDLTVGSSAWYYNSITKFVFRSVNAELGSQITGSYSAPGAGVFAVYSNNSGLDALAPGAFAGGGLTGVAPNGYNLISSDIYFFSLGRILGSNVLPDITNPAAPFSDFLSSPPPGGYAGALFSATYQPLSGGSDVTIYATLGTVAVPEPSTWAMMLVGFVGLGCAGYRRARTGQATRAA
ncbi:MAG TPA: PEP-CTERM sorting domain-containing protein [Roseiarcus sp.]|nr:PEP-CTERM sorting domain-containing protein [Roseiarcus sp.]